MSELNPGYVYFIRQGGWVKIGYSKDPESRLRDLQVASPTKLKLLRAEPGSPESERSYHDRFAALRGSGEWFMLLGELRDMLKEPLTESDAEPEPSPYVESIRMDCDEGAYVLNLRDWSFSDVLPGAEGLAAEALARHVSGIGEQSDLIQYIDSKAVYEETRPNIEAAMNHGLPDALSVSGREVRFYYAPFDHMDEEDEWEDDKVPPCNHDAIIDVVDTFDYWRPELGFKIAMVWDVGEFFRVPMRYLRKKLRGGVRVPMSSKRSWLDVYTGDEEVRDL